MAARTKHLIPLTGQDHEVLIQEIVTAEEPLTAGQVVKRVSLSRKVPEKEAAGILEDAASTDRIHPWPPKTSKGKPRYWGRNVEQAQREAIQAAIRDLEKPLTAREILRRIHLPMKLSEADLLPSLEDRIRSGTLHLIPATTAKGKPKFWNRDAVEFGRISILALLEKKGPQPETSLKRAVKWLKADSFRSLLQRMLSNREVYRHPVGGKIKRELFGSTLPRPGQYLEDWGKQFRKIYSILRGAEVPADEIRRSVIEVLESAGISLTRSHDVPHEARESGDVDLIALMKRIEPGASRGALIGTAELRRSAKLNKDQFDKAVLDLVRKGKLVLHRHDFPSSLSPAEREQLVNDDAGNYYVGVAIRQKTI